jgi:hypothetical protein
MNVWVTREGIVYDLFGMPHTARPIKMQFLNASADVRAVGAERRDGYHNYLLGSDPASHADFVPLYGEVRLERLYPGIDGRLYFEQGSLRYDLIVAAGADPGQIAVHFKGADAVSIRANNELVIHTEAGELRQRGLLAYQEIGGKRHTVGCRFESTGESTVAFRLDRFDSSLPLIIDPLVFSTFLGGFNWDQAQAIAVDGGGQVYVTGHTKATDFPMRDAYDDTHNGFTDVFVSKLSDDGRLLYSTFLGGSGWKRDEALAIAVDDLDQVYVVGFTESTSFPTTFGAYDTTHNGQSETFVTKLSTTGGGLLYSTFLGEAATGVAVVLDELGHLYVTGSTGSSDFPTTDGAYDTTHNGSSDAFVMKLEDDGSALVYSTFLGGTHGDEAKAIALAGNGQAYVTGTTISSDFPVTPDAYDQFYNYVSAVGRTDTAFVAALNASGSDLVYSTYLGGPAWADDEGLAIAVDKSGHAHVAGYTESVDFFTTPGAYDTTYNSYRDLFVVKLETDGSDLVYSTFVGGLGDDTGRGLALDDQGRVYLTGSTNSSDFPTTPEAHDKTINGLGDVFITAIDASGTALVYSTFLGGSLSDHGFATGLHGAGRVYVTGVTESSNFPTLDAFDDTWNAGVVDAFVAKLDLGFPDVAQVIFADGFESGDLTAWSDTVP